MNLHFLENLTGLLVQLQLLQNWVLLLSIQIFFNAVHWTKKSMWNVQYFLQTFFYGQRSIVFYDLFCYSGSGTVWIFVGDNNEGLLLFIVLIFIKKWLLEILQKVLLICLRIGIYCTVFQWRDMYNIDFLHIEYIKHIFYEIALFHSIIKFIEILYH